MVERTNIKELGALERDLFGNPVEKEKEFDFARGVRETIKDMDNLLGAGEPEPKPDENKDAGQGKLDFGECLRQAVEETIKDFPNLFPDDGIETRPLDMTEEELEAAMQSPLPFEQTLRFCR